MTSSKLSDKIGQFVTIPHSVVKMIPIIGAEAMTLFVYLRYRTNSKTGDAFPSYDTIQDETKLTRRRIAKALRVLLSVGLIERKRRFSKSTVYTLVLPDKLPISTPVDTNDISTPVETAISNDGVTDISNPVDTLSREKYQDRSKKTKSLRGKPRAHQKVECETCPQEWMIELYKLCGVDSANASGGMRKRISETGKTLNHNGNNAGMCYTIFKPYWIQDQWRREHTPYPTPEQVRDQWVRAIELSKGIQSGHTKKPEYTQHDLDIAAQINARRAEKAAASAGGAPKLQPQT